jgi:type IV secretion system protein VirB6
MIGQWLGSAVAGAADPVGGASQFVFFTEINNFLRDEIDIFQWDLLQRSTMLVGSVALSLMTIWILIQGYRIVTGQSREPMMALVGDSLRGALIIGLATSMAAGSSGLFWTLTDGMSDVVSSYVTGSNQSPFQSIDDNLAAMQVAMSTIDALDTGGDKTTDEAKERAMWFTGIGIAGPGVIAGAMLLLNKIAIALFVGFGPFFILSLLFPQTKSLFSKWLLYGIGTLFSLGVLTVMIGLAMRMVGAVTAAFVAKYYASMALTGAAATDGINSMALQQGGMGLVLSTLIVMAPPIAASFFQGTLAQFSAYSAFGNIGARQAGSQPPGTPGYQAPAPIDNSSSTAQTRLPNFNNHSGSSPAGAIAHQDTTKLKNFNSNTVG